MLTALCLAYALAALSLQPGRYLRAASPAELPPAGGKLRVVTRCAGQVRGPRTIPVRIL